jgi:hypothetical protein
MTGHPELVEGLDSRLLPAGMTAKNKKALYTQTLFMLTARRRI